MESQARYKAGFDDGVLKKNNDVTEGSWVLGTREVHEAGTNPKLDDQVDGPYKVVQTDGRTFLLRLGGDHIRVSSDHVTAVPTPEGELSPSVDRRRTDGSATSGNNPEEGTRDGDLVPVGGSARNNEGTHRNFIGKKQTLEMSSEQTNMYSKES